MTVIRRWAAVSIAVWVGCWLSQGLYAAELNQGSLVAVGGALKSSNAAIYLKFIELAGGKSAAKIGILPAASGKPSKYADLFKKDLIRYGVNEANIEIIPIAVKNDKTTKEIDESTWLKNAQDAKVSDAIKNYTGIWMTGGDQTRITQALLQADKTNTPALDAIWQMYQKGGVIGGTSAGAAVMSAVMISGGDSLGALRDGFKAKYESMDEQEFGPVTITQGLGFFTSGVMDQHFDRKSRIGRLIVVNYANRDKYSLGFGVDEDTAMVVYNDKKEMEVVGAGGVTIVDVSKAQKNEAVKMTAIKQVSISFLAAGDRYHLGTGDYTILPKRAKAETVGYEYFSVEDPMVTGVMSRNALLKHFITYDLLDNSKATAVKSFCFDKNGKGFELVFRQTDQSQGYWGLVDGLYDTYSAVNVMLDINPVSISIQPATQ